MSAGSEYSVWLGHRTKFQSDDRMFIRKLHKKCRSQSNNSGMLVYTFFVLAVLVFGRHRFSAAAKERMCVSTECEGKTERSSEMKNKPILPPKMLLSQLEDALEERQSNDRRQSHGGLPDGIQQERRKNDRRAQKHKKH